RPAEDAVRVDRPAAGGTRPLGALAAAERADRARVVMALAARRALLDEELAGGGGVPERLGLRIDRRARDRTLLRAHYSLPMISVALPWRVASETPVTWASTSSHIFTLPYGS